MSEPSAATAGGRTFFGHPRGLSTLFFTEMWERFSYYGMRAILVLYMVHAMSGRNPGMELDDRTATAIYGLYAGMVYLLALPGGWIADRIMGQRKAVFIGGIIIAAGHFSMAVPTMFTFFLGLVLIVLGTGLLKPNISAIVGDLYPEGGERRDAGFSIFYMGINIGAFGAPLICGYLGQQVNWHYGFAAAGVGMVLGLIQYAFGWKYLDGAGEFRGTKESLAKDRSSLVKALGAVVVLLVGVVVLSSLGVIQLTVVGVAQAMTWIIMAVALGFLTYVAFFCGLEPAESKRVGVIGILFVAACLFWSGFEQAGSSLNLFADRLTDTSLFGWMMPASWLQSVNALFIIILAPVFAALWVSLGRRAPSIPTKFALGLILLGAGFVVMVFASKATGYAGPDSDYQRVGMSWLVVTYLLHTFGELCLSPVGLSTMTKLAPRRFVGQMMGIWFMATSLGNVIAGQVAGLFESLPLPQIFSSVTLTTAGVGLILLLFTKPIQKLMGGVR